MTTYRDEKGAKLIDEKGELVIRHFENDEASSEALGCCDCIRSETVILELSDSVLHEQLLPSVRGKVGDSKCCLILGKLGSVDILFKSSHNVSNEGDVVEVLYRGAFFFLVGPRAGCDYASEILLFADTKVVKEKFAKE